MDPIRPAPAVIAEGHNESVPLRPKALFAVEPTAAEIVNSLLLPGVPGAAVTAPREGGDIAPSTGGLIVRRSMGENVNRPSSRGGSNSRPTQGGEKNKESLWRRFLSWWCICEPSFQALQDYRRDMVRKVGLPANASVEEASRKLNAPLGTIRDYATKPGGRTSPEKWYKKEMARRRAEEERKRKERAGCPKKVVDPRRLAVAPWLAED